MSPSRILIAEDHAATRRVLARMLERRGFEVRSAAAGAEAISIAKDCRLALFICDIGLPDMNGWEVLKRVRQHCPGVPAIAVTGFGRPEEVKASVDAGFNDHLTKPVTIDQIEHAITANVRKRLE